VDEQEVAFKALIRQRHMSYEAFCREWDRVAKSVDDVLTGHYPGRAQYYRWLRGELANKRPYPDACRILEAMFPGWPVEGLFSQYTGEVPQSADLLSKENRKSPTAEMNLQFGTSFDPAGMADRISELANWAETTNIGDSTLAYLNSATLQLAHDCLTVPPSQTAERADVLIKRINETLRSGRQRLAQMRDLYVIAGKLCAILSWISSDLGQLAVAEAHALNGWALADQAEHDGLRALLLSARSKIDFWRRRYGDAAKHARRGYEYDPPGTLRVLLACQEADALQAAGRIGDAMEALSRSERIQDAFRIQDDVGQTEDLGGIFGCGIARQSNYSIATYLRVGSIDQALSHVDRAERAWRNGDEWAYGTWAQVQIGAAIANVMNGEIDGAAMILQRILDQPAEKRLATLTVRLNSEVTPLLAGSAIGQSKLAIALREGIADYGQSPTWQLPAGGEL
jgi:tetratricopeptide (TPR) repeat protein